MSIHPKACYICGGPRAPGSEWCLEHSDPVEDLTNDNAAPNCGGQQTEDDMDTRADFDVVAGEVQENEGGLPIDAPSRDNGFGKFADPNTTIVENNESFAVVEQKTADTIEDSTQRAQACLAEAMAANPEYVIVLAASPGVENEGALTITSNGIPPHVHDTMVSHFMDVATAIQLGTTVDKVRAMRDAFGRGVASAKLEKTPFSGI